MAGIIVICILTALAGQSYQTPVKTIKPLTAVGTCPPVAGSIPDYLPDSEECNAFWECSNGVPYKFYCPVGTYFLHRNHMGNCVNDYNNVCPASRPAVVKELSPYSPVGECPPEDGPNPTYLADSDECNAFWECSHGTPFKFYCAPGDYFYAPNKRCELDYNNVCPASSTESARKLNPYSPVGECPPEDGPNPTYLADSDECNAFWECSHGTPFKFYCAPGDYFYAPNKRCELDYNNVCPASSSKSIKQLSPYSPVGECPPVQGEFPVYLPDSENCSIFYECDQNGNPLPVACRPGLEFNPVLNVCDYPEQAGCTAGGNKTEPSSVVGKSKKSKPYAPVGECPKEDGATPVYLPDAESCSYYYECSHGTPVQNVCPGKLEFNPNKNVCDFPDVSGCKAGTLKIVEVNKRIQF